MKDPNLAFVPEDAKAAWIRGPGWPRPGYEHVAEFLKKYSEAGGKVARRHRHGLLPANHSGLSLHYEMQMLTDIGIAADRRRFRAPRCGLPR